MARTSFLGALSEAARSRASWRTWTLAAQEGLIATAGILLGFAGAGAGDATLVIAATAATIAGMLSAGGSNWSQAALERDAQLSAVAEERAEIKLSREEARVEIVDYYEQKGLDRDLAIKVADQLIARSPLKAALESEHGILKVISHNEVLIAAMGSSIAYGMGAAIPFLLTYFLPVKVEGWLIILALLPSLILISIFAALLGRSSWWNIVRRMLVVGTMTISLSYVVAEIAF